MSSTPLFDEFFEKVGLLENGTIGLFSSQYVEKKYSHIKDLLGDSSQKKIDEHDQFLLRLKIFRIDPYQNSVLPVKETPFNQSLFYEMAVWGTGLPDPDLLRRELIQAIIPCPTEFQSDLLRSEIQRVHYQVKEIVSFILEDLPVLTVGWVDKFQKVYDQLIMDEDAHAMNVWQKLHWLEELPNAISYFGIVEKLLIRLHSYVITLAPFVKEETAINEVEMMFWAQKKRLERLIRSDHILTVKFQPDQIQTNRPSSQGTSEREEIMEKVDTILAPLGRKNPQKEEIMSKVDFDYLIERSKQLAVSNRVPDNMKSISKTGISNEHIRYIYYLLHKALFGTRRTQDSFIEFLHTVFSQFSNTAQKTTKAKFSRAPKSYQKDFDILLVK